MYQAKKKFIVVLLKGLLEINVCNLNLYIVVEISIF